MDKVAVATHPCVLFTPCYYVLRQGANDKWRLDAD